MASFREKSHHNPEMLLKECPLAFVDRIKRANSKNALWFWEEQGLFFLHLAKTRSPSACMWGAFPGTFAKKCLFNSWMLIGFSEDVSLKNDDCFLKPTLKPTTCFFKECQTCFLLKNANAHRACGTKKWSPKPIFREHKSPHLAVEM